MSDKQVAYIAGMGMVTSVGANVEMTAAAVRAGISGYAESEFFTKDDELVTMSLVPDEIFSQYDFEIDEGDYYSEQFDHTIKMANLAIRESLANLTFSEPIPLLLGMPEAVTGINYLSRKSLTKNLLNTMHVSVFDEQFQIFSTGRAAGIQAIDMALDYPTNMHQPYVLIGGSDSYFNFSLISLLSDEKRVLTENSLNSFAPGEAAGFILLTSSPKNALNINDHMIAVYRPGLSEEPGHMHSDETYSGEGLDKAFKLALQGTNEKCIDSIYSSINGESYWAKELGVSLMRNSRFFVDDYDLKHPADCLGDLGAATAPVMIGLAATDLLSGSQASNALVYCSSDTAWRGAVRLEKIKFPEVP